MPPSARSSEEDGAGFERVVTVTWPPAGGPTAAVAGAVGGFWVSTTGATEVALGLPTVAASSGDAGGDCTAQGGAATDGNDPDTAATAGGGGVGDEDVASARATVGDVTAPAVVAMEEGALLAPESPGAEEAVEVGLPPGSDGDGERMGRGGSGSWRVMPSAEVS